MLSLLLLAFVTSSQASELRDLSLQQLTEASCASLALSAIQSSSARNNGALFSADLDKKFLSLGEKFKQSNGIADSQKYAPLLQIYKSIPDFDNDFKNKCYGYTFLRLEECYPAYQKSASDQTPCILEMTVGGDFSIQATRNVFVRKLFKNQPWKPLGSDHEFEKDAANDTGEK
jgi:hypothetical protein